MIVQLSLSSKPKPVGATVHPVVGIPEFVSTLLSTLDPADALTFLKHEGMLSKVRVSVNPNPNPNFRTPTPTLILAPTLTLT